MGRTGQGIQTKAIQTTALLIALTAVLAGSRGIAREQPSTFDFGRFSETLVRCSISGPGAQRHLRSCGRLRIEQNLKGVLSVRFSLRPSGERYSSEDLVFAGMLSEASEPMACRGDGRCQPRFPVQLSVNAIASSLYSRLGLATTLPRARIARGQCRIEAVRASCEATGSDGERWQAEGFFLASPPADGRAAQR